MPPPIPPTTPAQLEELLWALALELGQLYQAARDAVRDPTQLRAVHRQLDCAELALDAAAYACGTGRSEAPELELVTRAVSGSSVRARAAS